MRRPFLEGAAMMSLDIHAVARQLGGDRIARDQVLAPGPGHSPRDRSLQVRLDSDAPDGFVCRSYANDAFDRCRDHVKERLRISPSGQTRQDRPSHPPKPKPADDSDAERTRRALEIWREG